MDIQPIVDPGHLGVADHRVDSNPQPSGMRRRSIGERILSGLLLALPLLITFWIIEWAYSVLEHKVIDPLAALLLWKLKWTTSRAELPFWFETYAAPVISLVVVLVLFFCFDLLADTRLRRAIGWTLRRVPLISHIYNPVQQVFQALEQPDQQRKQRMVLVTFPHPGVKLPAFVTATCRDIATNKTLLAVYIPTTPVPTSGFFLLVPEEEVTELNWNTEQTLQAIMSGGLTIPKEVTFYRDSEVKVRPEATMNESPGPNELPQPPLEGRPHRA